MRRDMKGRKGDKEEASGKKGEEMGAKIKWVIKWMAHLA